MSDILALFIGLVLPIGAGIQGRRRRGEGAAPTPTGQTKIGFYWTNGVMTLAMAAAAVGAWILEGGALASLGLQGPHALGFGIGLALLFLALFGLDSWLELSTPERRAATSERWHRDTPFMPANRREVVHSLALVTGAAVGEEVMFRGFLIAYLLRWFGNTPLAVAAAVSLPALVFGIAHSYQGSRAVLKIILLAGLFGAMLMLTGSLLIPIVLHFVVDLVGSLLGPGLLGAGPGPAEAEEPSA